MTGPLTSLYVSLQSNIQVFCCFEAFNFNKHIKLIMTQSIYNDYYHPEIEAGRLLEDCAL